MCRVCTCVPLPVLCHAMNFDCCQPLSPPLSSAAGGATKPPLSYVKLASVATIRGSLRKSSQGTRPRCANNWREAGLPAVHSHPRDRASVNGLGASPKRRETICMGDRAMPCRVRRCSANLRDFCCILMGPTPAERIYSETQGIATPGLFQLFARHLHLFLASHPSGSSTR